MNTQTDPIYEAGMERVRLHRDAREIEARGITEFWKNRINKITGRGYVCSDVTMARMHDYRTNRAQELRAQGDRILAEARQNYGVTK